MNRKSLADISWKVDEQTYRDDSGYSYSTLSRFQREGFNGLETLFDKIESPSLTFGSVVDTLITGTEQEFNEKFIVSEFPELADSKIKVLKELFALSGGIAWEEIPDTLFVLAVNNTQFQQNWKESTRVNVIKECGKEYYDLLCIAQSKTIVSNSVYEDALACVNALKTSPGTKTLFASNDPFNNDVERFYQLKFKGEFEGIPIRSMADLLYVDHVNKFVCPVDLKTSSHKEWDFGKSFIEYRYMIQAQLYWYLIRQAMDKDDYFKDFKLLNYRFVVVCNSSRIPLVWEFEDTQSVSDFTYGTRTIPNWRKILKELDFYMKHESTVPIGIKVHSTNSLRDWIKSNYE